MKKYLYATMLLGNLEALYANNFLYWETTSTPSLVSTSTSTSIPIYTPKGEKYSFNSGTSSKGFCYTQYGSAYSSSLKSELFVLDATSSGTAVDLQLLHFVSAANNTQPGFVHDPQFKFVFGTTPTNNNITSFASQALNNSSDWNSTSITFITLSSASLSTKQLTISNSALTVSSSMGPITYQEGIVKPLSQVTQAFSAFNQTVYSVSSCTITESYLSNAGLALQKAFSTESPYDYVVFGDCALGMGNSIYPTIDKHELGHITFSSSYFSVITSDDQGEIVNNQLPVKGTATNQLSPSYAYNSEELIEFYTPGGVSIDSTNANLSQNNSPTFPLPALYSTSLSTNNSNAFKNEFPLPGFSPITIPHTTPQMLPFSGATLPIRLMSLNKYYIHTVSNNGKYVSGDKINFKFAICAEPEMKTIKKMGTLSVTLA